MSLFTRINCLWYSALNKAKGILSNGWRMCVQCGGKQHTSTFFDFMYSMNPKLKRCDLCMSSSNRTLLFPAKIFFSVKNGMKFDPNSWNSLPLIYPVADPRIIYPVGSLPPFRLDLVCLENNEWGHSQPTCTHAWDNCAVLWFFPTHGLEGTFTGDTNYSCRLWYVAYAALFHIPYSIWGVIQPPGVQPFFVLLEKLCNLSWICSNCTRNRQVYSHLLPHFRESLLQIPFSQYLPALLLMGLNPFWPSLTAIS